MQIRIIRFFAASPRIQRQFIRYILPIAVDFRRKVKNPPYHRPLRPRISVFPRLERERRSVHVLPQMSGRILKRPPYRTAHCNDAQTCCNDGQSSIHIARSWLRLTIQYRELRARRRSQYAVYMIGRLVCTDIIVRQCNQADIISSLLVRPALCAGSTA